MTINFITQYPGAAKSLKCMMKLGLNIVWKTDKNEQDAYDVSCK